MASPEPPSSPPVLAAPAPLVNICSADPFDPSPYLFSCWRNNIMTDCTVVVDQGEHRVHAHQCVLSAASPVLKRILLCNDVRFNDRPTLILDGINRKTLLLFLKFIYTGETPMRRGGRVYQDFKQLCRNLRINPAVHKVSQKEPPPPPNENNVWPCPFCDKPFRVHTKLDFHCRRFHGGPVSQVYHHRVQLQIDSQEMLGSADEEVDVDDDEEVQEVEESRPKDGQCIPEEDHIEPEEEIINGSADLAKEQLKDQETDQQETMCVNLDENGNKSNDDDDDNAQSQNIMGDSPASPEVPKPAEEDATCEIEVTAADDAIEGEDDQFQMPDNFDLPDEIIERATSAAVGYAASPAPIEEEIAVAAEVGGEDVAQPVFQGGGGEEEEDEKVQENEVDSTSGGGQHNDTAESESIETIMAEVERLSKEKFEQEKVKELVKTKSSKASVDSVKKKEKLISDLFGDEQEQQQPKPGPSKEETKEVSRPPAKHHTSVMEELAAKRARVLNKIKADKRTGRINVDDVSKTSKKARELKWIREHQNRRRRRRHSSAFAKDKNHVCTSACPGDHAISDEDAWLVHDSEEGENDWNPKWDGATTSSDDGDAVVAVSRSSKSDEASDEGRKKGDEEHEETRKERRKKGKKKSEKERRKKYEIELEMLRDSYSESEDKGEKEKEKDEEESGRKSAGDGDATSAAGKSRKARLLERREREGLEWMVRGNGRRILVSEQNTRGDEIVGLREFRARLRRQEKETEDEHERTTEGEEFEAATTCDKKRKMPKTATTSETSEFIVSDDDDAEHRKRTKEKKEKKRRRRDHSSSSTSATTLSRSKSVLNASSPIRKRSDGGAAKDRRWLAYRRSISERATKDQDKRRTINFGSTLDDLFSTQSQKHSYGLSSERSGGGGGSGRGGSFADPADKMKNISFKKKRSPEKSAERNSDSQSAGLVVKKGRILSDSD